MFPFSQCEHIEGLPIETIQRFNPEVAFHLATLTTAENSLDLIQPLIETNITYGTKFLNILGECADFKLFVNTGSFSEYRAGTEQIQDATLYAATKSAFRVFIDYYSRLKGFKYITVTPYSVYGGKPTVKRLMDYLMESLNAEHPVSMTKGDQILDFIHVDDVVSFFTTILNNPAFFELLRQGTEFHLGTGIGTSIKELTSHIENLSGRKCNIRWGDRPYREQEIMCAVAPVAQNRELTEWSACIPLKEGIAMMLNIYESGKSFV
jgi:CDP-paratose synthetase